MKNVFLLGDFTSNDGVANANKNLKLGFESANLTDKVSFSMKTNKFARLIEFVFLFFKTDSVCLCGISKINSFAFFFSKVFKKPVYYLLHGYPFYEQTIEGQLTKYEMEEIKKNELIKFDSVEKIICVSYSAMKFMENQVPQYKEKMDYIFNPLNLSYLKNEFNGSLEEREPNLIVSTGGGRRIKNNLSVAKAIELINIEFDLNLIYIVVGPQGPDSENLKKINCVRLQDTVTHSEVLKLYKKAFLYIQNSYFETFGLAVVEALMLGCNLLISKNVSAKDILPSLTNDEIIVDNESIDEIKEKILTAINRDNNLKIKTKIELKKIEPTMNAKQLYNILIH